MKHNKGINVAGHYSVDKSCRVELKISLSKSHCMIPTKGNHREGYAIAF